MNELRLERLRDRSSLHMISNTRMRATEIQQHVTEAHLRREVGVSATPDEFKGHFTVILKEEGVSTTQFFKQLLKLVGSEEVGTMTSLSVVAAMVSQANTLFMRDLTSLFRRERMQIIEVNIHQFLQAHVNMEEIDVNDLSDLNGMEASHMVLALFICLTLIGKRLDSKNYGTWISRRLKSFSSPLGLTQTDDLLDSLVPTLKFATTFYDDVKVFWNVRRLFFLNIFAMAGKGDLLGVGAGITLTLLRGAELTNWNLISLWITQLNPDLWGWNELAKHLPNVCAAYAKYMSLGPLAEWCKLILPSTELVEFHSSKLEVPYAVARAIAAEYGGQSINLLDVARKQNRTSEIAARALTIVKLAGGARTTDVMAIRDWRYGTHENTAMHRVLDTGALAEEADEHAAVRPNLGDQQ